MRKFSLGAVGVTCFQVHERLPDAAAELAQFIKAGRAHQVRVWKYGIRRSGISTHVSPSGRSRTASAAGSVTAQPCTIHDLRSVRYKAGEPSGTESGSLATKVSSMFQLSFRACRSLPLGHATAAQPGQMPRSSRLVTGIPPEPEHDVCCFPAARSLPARRPPHRTGELD